MKIVFAIIVLILYTAITGYSQYTNDIYLESHKTYTHKNINQKESIQDTLLNTKSNFKSEESLKQRYVTEEMKPSCNTYEQNSKERNIIYRVERKEEKIFLNTEKRIIQISNEE